MLDCNLNRQKIYKNISNKLIVFDDILKHRYCADQVISAQNKSIKKKIKNLICDYKYFPLREDFKNRKFKKKRINKKLKKILVCLGGSSYNLGNKALINYFKDTSYMVTVIVGNEINKKNISQNNNINLIQNVKNISKLIWDADLVISGGGYLKIETAYLHTPMLVIPVQKHQLDLVKEFKKYCKVPYLNFPSNINNKILDNNLKKYKYPFRLNMSKLLKKKFNKNIFSKKILEIIKKI